VRGLVPTGAGIAECTDGTPSVIASSIGCGSVEFVFPGHVA